MHDISKQRVFISYSHKDKDWLGEIRIYLNRLERNYDFDFWDDTKIKPGSNWRDEIKNSIASANAALLLISEDFIASDFISKNELPPLLKKASENIGIRIFPLLLKPSSFKFEANINQFQAVNSVALSKLPKPRQNEVLVDMVEKIRIAMKKFENIPKQEEIKSTPDNFDSRKSAFQKSEAINLPAKLSDQRVLILDIDGALLNEGEKLSDSNKNEILDIFELFVNKDFHIVFITGNDYHIQKRKVLRPVIDRDLSASVTCFSDGGSRLFEFDKQISDYDEILQYSNENRITKQQVDFIFSEFNTALDQYLKLDMHGALSCPSIRELDRVITPEGRIKYVDLIIYPIKPSVYANEFDRLAEKIDQIINSLDIQSVHQIMDKYRSPHALILRIRGPYSNKDAEIIRDELINLFNYEKEYKDLAKPEIEKRGGIDFISQIALKPFKINKYRQEFLSIIKDRLSKNIDGKLFSVLFGGKTTIDIQLEGVDKRKAIIELITGKRKLNPKNMIYFGDEFVHHGNDLPVAEMEEHLRPARIIHVGDIKTTPEKLFAQKGIFIDGNGPIGTKNYLNFLKYEL
ncbi:TIR domain-containing protein [candidate division KSB1 bacterium]|nr:TIR domain-containing protein [candidate division KSB1 bacterium]